jgi:hypothetical protein
VLDSYAVLAWIQDEPGAQLIEDTLYRAQSNQEELLMNMINLGEVFYRCARGATPAVLHKVKRHTISSST